MTIEEYLQEHGRNQLSPHHVPDLIPASGAEIELLIVVESPHAEEVRAQLPLSGDAGRAAFNFLCPNESTAKALGPLVSSLHQDHDFRIAILNCSPVPLQRMAFAGARSSPDLDEQEWDLIEATRVDRATAISLMKDSRLQDTNYIVLRGLQTTVNSIRLAQNATIVLTPTENRASIAD